MKPVPATRFPPEASADPSRRTRARAYAFTLLTLFVLAVGLADYLLDQPRFMGARFAPCDAGLCVTWVMPVTQAWEVGVRAGDVVLSVDGRAAGEMGPGDYPRLAGRSFSYRDRAGEVIAVSKPDVSRSSTNPFALWSFGALIATLGALVLIRRPDLGAARLFGLFAVFCSVGLAIGPASGLTHIPLPLIVQYVALIGLGTVFLPLTLSLIEGTRHWSRSVLRIAVPVASGLLAFYALTVVRFASLYDWARLGSTVWLGASVVASVVCLAVLGARRPGANERKQAWILLTSFGVGMFPFIFLSILPAALGFRHLPPFVTILWIVCIPVGFAVAILQYGMLGIRRLIHRGIVYGVTAAILLAALALTLGFLGGGAAPLAPWAVALLVVAAALISRPLEAGVHRFIDRYVYRDVVDYGNVIDTVRTDLVDAGQTRGVAGTLLDRIVGSLNLESALLFLGDDPADAELAVPAGPRAPQVAAGLQNVAVPLAGPGAAVEFDWESNSMLVTPLSRAGGYLGHVVWGPKRGGEVFVADERRVIEAMAPILTLVLEERALSERLRDLNRRLLRAEEAERRRIAQDLHDGPLQKAVLLGGLADGVTLDRGQLARELTAELREVCARLRPAILDDLGLIPALDWLLTEACRLHPGVRTRLELEGADEDTRFPPDVEVALFRVTQESINNINKHAKASTIEVFLQATGSSLMLRVKDDGVGFSAEAGSAPGLGLPGMRERILQVGGRFEVRSEPGSGTELTAAVPAAAEESHGAD